MTLKDGEGGRQARDFKTQEKTNAEFPWCIFPSMSQTWGERRKPPGNTNGSKF